MVTLPKQLSFKSLNAFLRQSKKDGVCMVDGVYGAKNPSPAFSPFWRGVEIMVSASATNLVLPYTPYTPYTLLLF
jgi:hypothetical protein